MTKFNKIKVFKGGKIKRKNRAKKIGKPVLNVIFICYIRRLSQLKNFKNKDSRSNFKSNAIKMSKTYPICLKRRRKKKQKRL